MWHIDKVNKDQLHKFLKDLTDNELRYYDIQNDRIPETMFYINGAWDGDKLVGIGGLAVWYKTLPHLFFMIKEEYQGQGLGRKFSELNIEYAKTHNISFLFGSAKLKNTPSIKIVVNLGYKKVYSNGVDFFSILIIDKKAIWVKYFLRIIIPLYCTKLGDVARFLRKRCNW